MPNSPNRVRRAYFMGGLPPDTVRPAYSNVPLFAYACAATVSPLVWHKCLYKMPVATPKGKATLLQRVPLQVSTMEFSALQIAALLQFIRIG
ncbi:MAG TPA: hypothetical protein VF749_02000 [Candidatus Acidoferrum sp.]